MGWGHKSARLFSAGRGKKRKGRKEAISILHWGASYTGIHAAAQTVSGGRLSSRAAGGRERKRK